MAPVELSCDLPFPAGTSPFHLKGIVYRAHVDYAEQFIPGGEKGVALVFKDPALRAFLSQQFLASSWYDCLPIVPVWYACAALLHQTPVEFLKVRTRHQAMLDIHGVYRFLLKLVSSEAVSLRLPLVVSRYFDFGKASCRVIRPGVVRYEQTGVPLYITPWLQVVGETYLMVALEIAGAKTAQVRRLPPVETGEEHGLRVATLTMDVLL